MAKQTSIIDETTQPETTAPILSPETLTSLEEKTKELLQGIVCYNPQIDIEDAKHQAFKLASFLIIEAAEYVANKISES